MQKFFFQAVTAEGKQISGFISSNSLEEATAKLKSGGLSILTLEKPKDETLPTGNANLEKFEFEGTNKAQKKIRGTIEEENRYQAFRKLRVEYKLVVDYLVDVTLVESEKEAQKLAGVEEELETKLELELKGEAKKAQKKQKKTKGVDEIKQAAEDNEEERQFITQKIENVLLEIIPLLEENAEYIESIKKREIEERINLLMRIKSSNSVSHLKSLTKRILDEVSSDEIFLSDANIPEEMKEEIERRKSRFRSVGSEFDKAISKGLIDLQAKFSQINTEGLKETVKDIHLFDQVLNTFYLTLVGLWTWLSLFLLFHASLVLLFDRAASQFYLTSDLLWYGWGVALVFLLNFCFLHLFNQEVFWKRALYILGSLFLGILVHTVQFPVIFFWTQ